MPISLSEAYCKKLIHSRMQKYLPLVRKYSAMYGVDPNYVLAEIRIESNFHANARGVPVKKMGGERAHGLMQLMPRYYAKAAGGKSRLLDPETNIRLGVRTLARNIKRFGSERLASYAYFAGGGATSSYLKGKRVPGQVKNYGDKVLSKKMEYEACLGGGTSPLLLALLGLVSGGAVWYAYKKFS
jgi:soluble lytic murein transglycosylase-like protein